MDFHANATFNKFAFAYNDKVFFPPSFFIAEDFAFLLSFLNYQNVSEGARGWVCHTRATPKVSQQYTKSKRYFAYAQYDKLLDCHTDFRKTARNDGMFFVVLRFRRNRNITIFINMFRYFGLKPLV
ncbi:hypothetical protein [Helicobacter sp. T3_23-1059]